MKKYLLPGILLLISTSPLLAQAQPLSSSLFMEQDKDEKTETYQCIQIRRGDKITLTGRISLYEVNRDEAPESLILTSDGGRVFLLKGDLLPELKKFFLQNSAKEKITLKGTVLYEGREEIPAEMEVSAYKPLKDN